METPPVKSSGDADGSFVKKLKEFDGLAMSIGNGNVNSNEHGSDRKLTERYVPGNGSCYFHDF